MTQVANQVAIGVENALAYSEIAELKDRLAQEKLYLEDELRGEMDFEGIVGQSSALRHVLNLVETVASGMAGPVYEAKVNPGCRTCPVSSCCPVHPEGEQVTP